MRPPKQSIRSYGIRERSSAQTVVEKAAEELLTLGYCVIDSGYAARDIRRMASLFDAVHAKYVDTFGAQYLRDCDEYDAIRLPLAFDERFIELAANPRVLELVQLALRNEFILNQQNGVINPPRERYAQGAWHRDLPYQHFVSSRPLAVNALYCVDDFTASNGASYVLPATHLQESFPSDAYVMKMARQLAAPAGSFIVMHAMLFHKGGVNRTSKRRRAVNHLYTVAFAKQQIDIPSALGDGRRFAKPVADLLGYRFRMPRNVSDFLKSRQKR
jgi:ectoine hydroxylase-related dioxygenase (phytanoyl-CoA dioxygenase family)